MTIDKALGAYRSCAGALPSGALMALVLLAALLVPEGVMAQSEPGVAAPQMRHFWHVFVAYAVAWALLFGWMFSIFRRLGRVEEKLDRP